MALEKNTTFSMEDLRGHLWTMSSSIGASFFPGEKQTVDFWLGRVMDGTKSLQIVRTSRPRKETEGGFLGLGGLDSLHSSFWRSDYKNRRGLFALFRVDDLAFPVLYLERARCVAQVGQMAELLVCEFHLSKG